MAQYNVTCRQCSKEFRVNLVGKIKDREWKLQSWGWLCEECKEKEKEKKNQEAAARNQEQGLPPLVGSEKQISWAEKLRHDYFKYIQEEKENFLEDGDDEELEKLKKVEGILKNFTNASIWIDIRNLTPGKIITRFEKEIFTQIDLATAAPAKVEATVRPEAPATETVAEIAIQGDVLSVSFPERLDSFRETIKGIGFSWNFDRKAWERKITSFSGPVKDRAAETGHVLLSRGFIVRIFDESVRNRAVSGEYLPEQTRWVMVRTAGKYSGWFCINWKRPDDFYQEARKIPGSRWDSPSMVVPSEHYQEVIDFAEQNDFKLSNGANNLIEKTEMEKQAMLTISVKAPAPQPPVKKDGIPPVLEVPATVGVDDELKD